MNTFRWTRPTLLVGVLLTIAALSACRSSADDRNGREVEPPDPALFARAAAVPKVDVRAVATANNAFGFALLDQLDDDGANVCISPHSVATVLSMTQAGARGGTRDAMRQTLRASLPEERLHPGAFALDIALRESATDPVANVTLAIANRVYIAEHFEERLLPGFRTTLDEWYGAALALADFVNAPGPSAADING